MTRAPSRPDIDALRARRAELVAENEAATEWGAAVGARHEEIRAIDRQLASPSPQPVQDAEEMREKIGTPIYDEWVRDKEIDAPFSELAYVSPEDYNAVIASADRIIAEIIAPLIAQLEEAREQLRKVTNPAYLEEALTKIGAVDGEWKVRAEKAEAALATAQAERDRAVEEEREACAALAASFGTGHLSVYARGPGDPPGNAWAPVTGTMIANAIRSRTTGGSDA